MGRVIKFCNKHSSAAMAVHFGNAETGGGESVLNSRNVKFPTRDRHGCHPAQVYFSRSLDRSRARVDGKRVEGLAVSLESRDDEYAWRWIPSRNCCN
jgi:hypothetical protein